MGEPVKGTVTSLSSIFPPEEAHKASIRVQETISEQQKEVDQLQGFLNDNTSLVNLIKKLPDQLHHDIMVPFGKAAFFPGRLIHTNEFLVLLGEGYFAERTSKQTVDILKRRGKSMESQIETLKAVMQDLEAEASFFDSTATEAAEGIVEIREEYIDEASSENKTETAGYEEYARILSRIDELEKEELEAEAAEECEEDNEAAEECEEDNEAAEEREEGNEAAEECKEDNEAELSHLISQTSLRPEVESSEVLSDNWQEEPKHENSKRDSSFRDQSQDFSKQFKPEASISLPVTKDSDLSSHQKVPASSVTNVPESIELNKSKAREHVAPVLQNEAFTGTIVEHTHHIENSQKVQESVPASKPVSRFKLHRK